MNILFITSTRLGDAVLSTALLDQLIIQNPNARVTVACGAVAAPLFCDMPRLERILVIRKMSLSLHWLLLWIKTVSKVWDLVIDLRASALSWLIITKSRRILKTAVSQQPSHRLEQLAFVLGLGDVPTPRVWLHDSRRAQASLLIPSDAPFLAVGPTSNWGGKRWSSDGFCELVQRLTAKGAILEDAYVGVFGAPWEHPMARPVINSIPIERRLDLVGIPNLLVTAACLERATLFIGNDSGLMHLAASMGTPTLGLFGPSQEVHYAPWGPHCAVVRTAKSYKEIRNDPDYDYHLQDSWMSTLSVDAVEDAATALWKRTSQGSLRVDSMQ